MAVKGIGSYYLYLVQNDYKPDSKTEDTKNAVSQTAVQKEGVSYEKTIPDSVSAGLEYIQGLEKQISGTKFFVGTVSYGQTYGNSSDVNFDVRFSTIDGCRDIAHKITTSIYGRFLPQASKILLYENKLVGFCLTNVTGDGIANLPLIGILPEHRGQKLSKSLVKAAVLDVVKLHQGGIIELNELNASLDLNLQSAVRMYESAGFVQAYRYSQAYLPRG